jgi:hypothetical protein
VTSFCGVHAIDDAVDLPSFFADVARISANVPFSVDVLYARACFAYGRCTCSFCYC